MKWYSIGTGVWTSIFTIGAMMTASGFFIWKGEDFSAGNWLQALATCAGLYAAVIAKRAVDNSKLAKDGVGDGGA